VSVKPELLVNDVGADVVLTQCPVGVQRGIGAGQGGGGALGFEHVEQVTGGGEMTAEPAGEWAV
jgi:hypothetical protein